uniref:NTF2 domain-containing protein n=1 Tax=Anopheles minimus TaxID=112268 RepID=A0A182WL39_9DIPT
MAINPQYEEIGKGFVTQYYALFDDSTQRPSLVNLYNAELSFMTFEGQQIQGAAKILEKLQSLTFQNIKRVLTAVDSQPMFDGGVLINVLGRLQCDEDPPHAYSQTFETKRRIGMLDLPYEAEYRGQLTHLGYNEKDIVKEAFLRQEWNMGSARVLNMLQEANILTASEYILSLDTIELMQQIMNDLLETEYNLLAHIIRYAYQGAGHHNVQSHTLTNILKESFRALLSDLKETPNVIPRSYFHALQPYLLPAELKRVTDEHLQLLLVGCDTIDGLDEAIGKQAQWRDEMKTLRGTVLDCLLRELVHDKAHFIDVLKGFGKTCCPFSIKYALYLLHAMAQTVTLEQSEDKLLKNFLKELFRSVVEMESISEMKLLLLFAREISTANEAILGTYSSWYKQTIGEMTYSVRKHQFISTMEMLTALLPLEQDLEVLEVHSRIAISAPAKCNDYVLSYKQLCRAHIAQLKASGSTTIVLED